MRCSLHGDREAAGMCVSCMDPYCGSCLVDIGRRYYCRACAASPGVVASSQKSPTLAVILSFLWPGLGQIYNGQLNKGLLMLAGGVVFGVLCFFSIGLPFFLGIWIWSMVDAGLTAGHMNRGGVAGSHPAMAPSVAPRQPIPVQRQPGAVAPPAPESDVSRPVPPQPAAQPRARVTLPDLSALSSALEDRQRTQQLLANLDNMKTEGTVAEAEYERVRGGYIEGLNEASVRLQSARERLRGEAASANTELEGLRKELREAELRHKVGETDEQAYLGARNQLEPLIAEREAFVRDLEKVASADDPEDIRAYLPATPSAPPSPTPPAQPAAPPAQPLSPPPVGAVRAYNVTATSTLATIGASIPLEQETATRIAWLSVGAMLGGSLQPVPVHGVALVPIVLAALTSVVAAVCVIALHSPSARMIQVGAAAFAIVIWVAGVFLVWGRLSWWFFGAASIALLASTLAGIRHQPAESR